MAWAMAWLILIWVMIYHTARETTHLQVFSLFSGVYISETAHKSLRKPLGVMQSMNLSFGFLTPYALGYFIESWRVIMGILAVLPLGHIAMQTFMPETPYWYIENDREDEAR